MLYEETFTHKNSKLFGLRDAMAQSLNMLAGRKDYKVVLLTSNETAALAVW